MAKKKRNRTKTVLFICILSLAAFGSWVLWDKYGADMADTADKVSKRAEKVKEAFSD